MFRLTVTIGTPHRRILRVKSVAKRLVRLKTLTRRTTASASRSVACDAWAPTLSRSVFISISLRWDFGVRPALVILFVCLCKYQHALPFCCVLCFVLPLTHVHRIVSGSSFLNGGNSAASTQKCAAVSFWPHFWGHEREVSRWGGIPLYMKNSYNAVCVKLFWSWAKGGNLQCIF